MTFSLQGGEMEKAFLKGKVPYNGSCYFPGDYGWLFFSAGLGPSLLEPLIPPPPSFYFCTQRSVRSRGFSQIFTPKLLRLISTDRWSDCFVTDWPTRRMWWRRVIDLSSSWLVEISYLDRLGRREFLPKHGIKLSATFYLPIDLPSCSIAIVSRIRRWQEMKKKFKNKKEFGKEWFLICFRCYLSFLALSRNKFYDVKKIRSEILKFIFHGKNLKQTEKKK